MRKAIRKVSARPRKPRRSRWRPLLWGVLGALILAGSFFFAQQYLPPQTQAQSEAPPPSAHDEELKRINAFGHVDVPRGVTLVKPLIGGKVAKILVKENETVKADAVLVQLDDTVARRKLQLAKVALTQAKIAKDKAELLPEDLSLEKKQLASKIAGLRAEEQGLNAQADELKKLRNLNQPEKQKEIMVSSGLKQVAEKIKAAELEQKDLPKKERDLQRARTLAIREAENAIELQNNQVALAERAVEEHKIKAPYDGFVLRSAINIGDTVSPRDPIPAITFCSSEPMIVRAEVDQEWAHLVKKDMEVIVRDDSRSALQWKGKVKRISRWFEKPRTHQMEPRQLNDIRTLECIIEFEEPPKTLRIGQRVSVTFHQN